MRFVFHAIFCSSVTSAKNRRGRYAASHTSERQITSEPEVIVSTRLSAAVFMRHPSGLLPTYATRSVKSSEPPTPTDVASGTSCTSTSPGVHVSTLLLCGAAGTSARLSAGAGGGPRHAMHAHRTAHQTVYGEHGERNTTASAEKNTMRRRRYRRLRSAAVMRFLPPVVRVVPTAWRLW